MNCLLLVSDEGYGNTVRQSCIANELIMSEAKITFKCRDPIPLLPKSSIFVGVEYKAGIFTGACKTFQCL